MNNLTVVVCYCFDIKMCLFLPVLFAILTIVGIWLFIIDFNLYFSIFLIGFGIFGFVTSIEHYNDRRKKQLAQIATPTPIVMQPVQPVRPIQPTPLPPYVEKPQVEPENGSSSSMPVTPLPVYDPNKPPTYSFEDLQV